MAEERLEDKPQGTQPIAEEVKAENTADIAEESTSSNKRIAKNALMLYVRMFLSMIVGLYTSRVVLATLGVEDYGIYGVVGGVVAMMGFLNASMSGATSRFLTFELGRGDRQRLADTFSSALIVHIGIALVVFVLAETVGLWFLCNKLVIPDGRMEAAHWVYQCSILSAMLSITQAPYNASIIAHEKMDVYAYVEILNVSLKLLIVYLLVIGNFDKLKLYAVLTLAVGVTIMLIYRIYCIRRFPETHFRWIWKKEYIWPLLSFSGWDLYGNASTIARTQGVNVLVNMFFGTVANAAVGVATMVQSILMQFSSNVSTAVRPQIIKSYSVGDISRMNSLLLNSAKYLYILLLLLSLPILIETHFVLQLWLEIIPEYTVWFTRFMLLFNFFAAMSFVYAIGIHATGKMKRISLINGSLYLSVVPITYVLYKFGFNIYTAFVFNVIAVFIGCLSNVYSLRLYINEIKVRNFIFKVILPVLAISLISLSIALVPIRFYAEGWLRFLLVTALSTTTILLLTFLSADKDTRQYVLLKIRKYATSR